ncbi:MAG: transglutaminase-like domain-containing protein [Candidatus Daviesbacteria bacterium]|nr:transglutaminase-like domain-containing protein [Candidatus Daviesbacteria bacterium]
MVKKILITVFFLAVFTFVPKAYAAPEFATGYDVLYDVDESGVTTVTEKVTLKNLTSEYYANQFKLTIGATQISDIKASDPGGALSVSQEQTGISTAIGIKFNQQVAGLGKTLPWTISFKSKDFAEKVGKVWEVRIPKISSSSNLESYNLTLAVPRSFGQPSLISPSPKSQTVSESKIFIVFDKDQIQTSGVSANFGINQLFDFNLTYHLENKQLIPVITQVALPPDTSFQDVIFARIEPKPLNVTVDDDGNYLAWFRLNRGQKLDVKVFGSAKLYTSSKVKNFFLEEVLRKKYTEAQKYWEKDNPQIIAKLKEILGDDPPKDSEEKTKLIFEFVVNYLKYDPGRLKNNIERLGAVTALNNPNSAVCMEFTDLFIALARAAGIPTRELDGYAYTANTTLRPLSLTGGVFDTKDILHAWPEYWDDRRGWVMVDPTWENTTGGVDYFNKLDLNHFVFAIKGSSSEEPIPAGSYKFEGKDTNDVKVTLSDTDFLGKPQIDAVIETSDPILSGFPGVLRVKLINTGNAFYPSAPLVISTNNILVLNVREQKLGPIPPFGSAEFNFNIRTKSLLDSFRDQVLVSVGGQKFTKEVRVSPFVLFRTVPLMIGAVAGVMVLVYFVVLGGHFYRRRVKKAMIHK